MKHQEASVFGIKERDLLVTLNVKVDGLISDFKELRDGLSSRVLNLENKVQVIEESHAGFNPQDTVQEFRLWKDRLKFISWLLIPVYLSIIGILVDRFFKVF